MNKFFDVLFSLPKEKLEEIFGRDSKWKVKSSEVESEKETGNYAVNFETKEVVEV